ncbi:molybdate ABC transporter permease subunit [Fusibacter paucivorans]|uniref:Molybdenum transport system permease n=1 Tax=Fusibacter paucivorans TaxID=76009 RepID=A0ABS5PTE3_9FIRM|nr:molybdate ABC transporter permease subunit [Fusibacter paucivorans]MBS7528443.1 molybdate ABC transporter permease subunit [Fusibacter paucivorans]
MQFDWTPAIVSLKVALVSTTIIFFLGLSAAWRMANYGGKWRVWIDSILTLPLVLPPTVVGFLLLVLIGKHGPIGILLSAFDIKIIFSWGAAVVSAVVVAFPLMYRTTIGAFEQIDQDLLNAARTLGASESKIFWRVAIPLAWPGIAAATALSFARVLGEFGATLMVSGNIPGKTQTIPLAIYFAAEGGKLDVAGIWAIIIFAVSMGAILLINNGSFWFLKPDRRRADGH